MSLLQRRRNWANNKTRVKAKCLDKEQRAEFGKEKAELKFCVEFVKESLEKLNKGNW